MHYELCIEKSHSSAQRQTTIRFAEPKAKSSKLKANSLNYALCIMNYAFIHYPSAIGHKRRRQWLLYGQKLNYLDNQRTFNS